MKKIKVLAIIALALALGLVTASPAVADSGYTLTDLGFIGGPSSDFMSQALGINNSSVVVGQTRTPSGIDAFVWYGAPPLFDLPILGSSLSQALDVSDAGDIVGWYQPGACCNEHAFWNAGGNTVDVNPAGAVTSRATAVNDSHVVVGWYGSGTPDAVRGFYSNAGAAPQDLGTFGGTISAAYDINDAGTIVGYASTSSGDVRAAVWSSPTATPLNLGVLSPGFGTRTEATAISSTGVVAGWSNDPCCGVLGWIYEGRTLTDGSPFLEVLVGALPTGVTRILPTGINKYETVVGNLGRYDGVQHAFIWRNSQLFDLNQLVSQTVDGEPMMLLTANAINDNGEIVGMGYVPGSSFFPEEHAYLLSPNTEPGTNVVVQPVDQSGSAPVTLTFSDVTQPGGTTLTTLATGPGPPGGFSLGVPAVYYELGTTASFTGSIKICIDSTGTSFSGSPTLWHYENGAWVDVTTSVNGTIVCGSVTSLSPFALFAGPTYHICLLYDPNKAVKAGSTIPIKLQLCDASGANLSSPDVVLHATGVKLVSTDAPGALEDTGNANPDNSFRYDAILGGTGGYIYNLSTRGLATGTYALEFTAGSDTHVYQAQFQVR
jgi:probable HAF family extracellular repeat protein